MARSLTLSRFRKPSVIPGFGLTFGFAVTYLSLIVLIPIAAGLLYPGFGIQMSPIFAGFAMALVSVSVVSNALRLRGFAAPLRDEPRPAPELRPAE